jgi:DNA primase catalytic core
MPTAAQEGDSGPLTDGDKVITPDGPGEVKGAKDDSILVATAVSTRVWALGFLRDSNNNPIRTVATNDREYRNQQVLAQARTPDGHTLTSGHRLRNLDTDSGHGEVVDVTGNLVGWVRARTGDDGKRYWWAQDADGGSPEHTRFHEDLPVTAGVPAARAAGLLRDGIDRRKLTGRTDEHGELELKPRRLITPDRGICEITLTPAQVRELSQLQVSGTYADGTPIDTLPWNAGHRRYSPFSAQAGALASAARQAAARLGDDTVEDRRRKKVLLGAAQKMEFAQYEAARVYATLPPIGEPDPYDRPYVPRQQDTDTAEPDASTEVPGAGVTDDNAPNDVASPLTSTDDDQPQASEGGPGALLSREGTREPSDTDAADDQEHTDPAPQAEDHQPVAPALTPEDGGRQHTTPASVAAGAAAEGHPELDGATNAHTTSTADGVETPIADTPAQSQVTPLLENWVVTFDRAPEPVNPKTEATAWALRGVLSDSALIELMAAVDDDEAFARWKNRYVRYRGEGTGHVSTELAPASDVSYKKTAKHFEARIAEHTVKVTWDQVRAWLREVATPEVLGLLQAAEEASNRLLGARGAASLLAATGELAESRALRKRVNRVSSQVLDHAVQFLAGTPVPDASLAKRASRIERAATGAALFDLGEAAVFALSGAEEIRRDLDRLIAYLPDPHEDEDREAPFVPLSALTPGMALDRGEKPVVIEEIIHHPGRCDIVGWFWGPIWPERVKHSVELSDANPDPQVAVRPLFPSLRALTGQEPEPAGNAAQGPLVEGHPALVAPAALGGRLQTPPLLTPPVPRVPGLLWDEQRRRSYGQILAAHTGEQPPLSARRRELDPDDPYAQFTDNLEHQLQQLSNQPAERAAVERAAQEIRDAVSDLAARARAYSLERLRAAEGDKALLLQITMEPSLSGPFLRIALNHIMRAIDTAQASVPTAEAKERVHAALAATVCSSPPRDPQGDSTRDFRDALIEFESIDSNEREMIAELLAGPAQWARFADIAARVEAATSSPDPNPPAPRFANIDEVRAHLASLAVQPLPDLTGPDPAGIIRHELRSRAKYAGEVAVEPTLELTPSRRLATYGSAANGWYLVAPGSADRIVPWSVKTRRHALRFAALLESLTDASGNAYPWDADDFPPPRIARVPGAGLLYEWVTSNQSFHRHGFLDRLKLLRESSPAYGWMNDLASYRFSDFDYIHPADRGSLQPGDEVMFTFDQDELTYAPSVAGYFPAPRVDHLAIGTAVVSQNGELIPGFWWPQGRPSQAQRITKPVDLREGARRPRPGEYTLHAGITSHLPELMAHQTVEATLPLVAADSASPSTEVSARSPAPRETPAETTSLEPSGEARVTEGWTSDSPSALPGLDTAVSWADDTDVPSGIDEPLTPEEEPALASVSSPAEDAGTAADSPKGEPDGLPLPPGMRRVHRDDVRPGDVVRFIRDGGLRDAVLILATAPPHRLDYDEANGGGLRGEWDTRDDYVVVVDHGPDRTIFNRYIDRMGDYLRNYLAEQLVWWEERRQHGGADQGMPGPAAEQGRATSLGPSATSAAPDFPTATEDQPTSGPREYSKITKGGEPPLEQPFPLPIDYTPLTEFPAGAQGAGPQPPAPASLRDDWYKLSEADKTPESVQAAHANAADARSRAAVSTARDVAELAAGSDRTDRWVWSNHHPLAQYDENAAAALERLTDRVERAYATQAVLQLRAAVEAVGREATADYVQRILSAGSASEAMDKIWPISGGVQADDTYRLRVRGIVLTYLKSIAAHTATVGLDTATIVDVLEDAAGWDGRHLPQLGLHKVELPHFPAAEQVTESARFVADAVRKYALRESQAVDSWASHRETWRAVEPRPSLAEPATANSRPEHAPATAAPVDSTRTSQLDTNRTEPVSHTGSTESNSPVGLGPNQVRNDLDLNGSNQQPGQSKEEKNTSTPAAPGGDSPTPTKGAGEALVASAASDFTDEERQRRQDEVAAIVGDLDVAEQWQRAMGEEQDERLVDLLEAYRNGNGDPGDILRRIADELEEFAAEVEATERGTGRGRLGAGWARKARDLARQAASRHGDQETLVADNNLLVGNEQLPGSDATAAQKEAFKRRFQIRYRVGYYVDYRNDDGDTVTARVVRTTGNPLLRDEAGHELQANPDWMADHFIAVRNDDGSSLPTPAWADTLPEGYRAVAPDQVQPGAVIHDIGVNGELWVSRLVIGRKDQNGRTSFYTAGLERPAGVNLTFDPRELVVLDETEESHQLAEAALKRRDVRESARLQGFNLPKSVAAPATPRTDLPDTMPEQNVPAQNSLNTGPDETAGAYTYPREATEAWQRLVDAFAALHRAHENWPRTSRRDVNLADVGRAVGIIAKLLPATPAALFRASEQLDELEWMADVVRRDLERSHDEEFQQRLRPALDKLLNATYAAHGRTQATMHQLNRDTSGTLLHPWVTEPPEGLQPLTQARPAGTTERPGRVVYADGTEVRHIGESEEATQRACTAVGAVAALRGDGLWQAVRFEDGTHEVVHPALLHRADVNPYPQPEDATMHPETWAARWRKFDRAEAAGDDTAEIAALMVQQGDVVRVPDRKGPRTVTRVQHGVRRGRGRKQRITTVLWHRSSGGGRETDYRPKDQFELISVFLPPEHPGLIPNREGQALSTAAAALAPTAPVQVTGIPARPIPNASTPAEPATTTSTAVAGHSASEGAGAHRPDPDTSEHGHRPSAGPAESAPAPTGGVDENVTERTAQTPPTAQAAPPGQQTAARRETTTSSQPPPPAEDRERNNADRAEPANATASTEADARPSQASPPADQFVPSTIAPYPDSRAYASAHDALLGELDQHQGWLDATPAAAEAADALHEADTPGSALSALLALREASPSSSDRRPRTSLARRLDHHIRCTQLTLAKFVIADAATATSNERLQELHRIAYRGQFIASIEQTDDGEMEIGQYLRHRADQIGQQSARSEDPSQAEPATAEEDATMAVDTNDDIPMPVFEVPGEAALMTAAEGAPRLLQHARAHLAAGSPTVVPFAHLHGSPVYAMVLQQDGVAPALFLGLARTEERDNVRSVHIGANDLADITPETLLSAVTAWINADDNGGRLLDYVSSVPAQEQEAPPPDKAQQRAAALEEITLDAAPTELTVTDTAVEAAASEPNASSSPPEATEAQEPTTAAASDRRAEPSVPSVAGRDEAPGPAPAEEQTTPPANTPEAATAAPEAPAAEDAGGERTGQNARAADEITSPSADGSAQHDGTASEQSGAAPPVQEDAQVSIGDRVLAFADHVLQTVSTDFGLGNTTPNREDAAASPDDRMQDQTPALEETVAANTAQQPAPAEADPVHELTALARTALSNLGATVNATGVLTAPRTVLITLETTGNAERDRDLADSLRKALHEAIRHHPDQSLASYRVDLQHTHEPGQTPLQGTPTAEAASVPRERLIAVNTEAAKIFAERLQSDPHAELARTYLTGKRHLPADVQQKWELGYAPSDRGAKRWDVLSKELLRRGFTEEELLQAGLADRSSRSGKLYDSFADRIMFPIHDAKGDIVGFGGRRIDRPGETEDQAKERGGPKYLNTRETAIFSKGDVVFGLYHPAQATARIESNGPRVSVEGYLDVIAVARAAETLPPVRRPVAGAPMGDALTERQLSLLRDIDSGSPRPHVMFRDNDPTGRKALLKSWKLLLEKPGSTEVTNASDTKDAADLWEGGIESGTGGAAPVLQTIQKRQPLLDAAVETALTEFADEAERANHAFDSTARVRCWGAARTAARLITDVLERQAHGDVEARRHTALTWAKRLHKAWQIPGHMVATAVLLGPGQHDQQHEYTVLQQALDLLAADPQKYFANDPYVRSRNANRPMPTNSPSRATTGPATHSTDRPPGQWPAGTDGSAPAESPSPTTEQPPTKGEPALTVFLPGPPDGHLVELTDRTTAAYALHTALHDRLVQHTTEIPEPNRLPQPLKLGTVHGIDLATSGDDQTSEDPTIVLWLGPSRRDSLRLSYSRLLRMTGPEILAAVEWRAARAAGLLDNPLSQTWRDAVRSIIPPAFPARPTPQQLADLLDTVAQSPDGSDERIRHRAEQALDLYTAGHPDLALDHLAAPDHIWVLRNDGSWIQEEAPGTSLTLEQLSDGFRQESAVIKEVTQAAAALPPGDPADDQSPLAADLTVAHHSAHEAIAALRPYSIGLPGTIYEQITDLVAQMDATEPAMRRLRGPEGERLMNRAKASFVRVLEGLATVASKIRLTGLSARLEHTVARLRGQEPSNLPAPRKVRTDRRMQDLAHIERDLERRMADPATPLDEIGKLQEQWIINRARWRARYEQLHGQPVTADFLPDNGLVAGAPPIPNLMVAHDMLMDRLSTRVAELRDTDQHTGEDGNPYDPTADLLTGVYWAYQQRLVGTVPTGPDPEGPIPAAQLRQAALTVTSHRNASPLTLRRTMAVTAERADRLLQRLEEHQVIGPYRTDAPRTVLVRPVDIDAMLARPATPPAPRPQHSAQPTQTPARPAEDQELVGADSDALEARIQRVVSKYRADQLERSKASGRTDSAEHTAPTPRDRKAGQKEAQTNALAAGHPTSITPSQP